MKEFVDSDLKAEIESISKRIDHIVKNVEELDPAKKKAPEAAPAAESPQPPNPVNP